jgi:hypothetical protein
LNPFRGKNLFGVSQRRESFLALSEERVETGETTKVVDSSLICGAPLPPIQKEGDFGTHWLRSFYSFLLKS